jgi:glycosyltransferase involved in cell wall biosynthesis
MTTKLIIQIPCYNEEHSLGTALSQLPREVEGFDVVEWLVVDDGSTDGTVRVAREHGVDHVVSFKRNQGLARGFLAGIDACLKAGADVIVNTDADNQYCAEDIPKLVAPILDGRADIVIGERPITEISDFSAAKKILQRLGSWVVRFASRSDVPDAPSGFRAMSREAAARLNVFNDYTYTLETIIQAGRKGMAVCSVPIRTNPGLRPSRLVKSIPNYVRRSGETILRISMTYRPFRFFALPGVISLSVGFLIGLRFLYFYFEDGGAGHVQSLLLGTLLLGLGFFLMVIGLVADLLSVNRKLSEDIQYRLKTVENLILAQDRRREAGEASSGRSASGRAAIAAVAQPAPDIQQAHGTQRVGQGHQDHAVDDTGEEAAGEIEAGGLRGKADHRFP